VLVVEMEEFSVTKTFFDRQVSHLEIRIKCCSEGEKTSISIFENNLIFRAEILIFLLG